MAQSIPSRDILPVTLGTAGHIDHGKTTLLRALAGDEGDTDRLAEERARGLTIDIGYAELRVTDDLEVGVVDVPGHEKFIRNMVAGATGIDVVLLVVAADDGVMPQTREHLQIMSLLGLSTGVVAITKADTVDAEMVELVASEVEDLLEGTFLEGAEMVPVSAVTGLGLDELRSEIARLVRAAPRRDVDGFFRMPVLRVFTSEGFGTIVTGIPSSGRISVGDKVHLQPGARAGRVRGLQVYHRPANQAEAGHRTAINVADLERKKVRRGDVVCEPDVFVETRVLDAKLHVLDTMPRPLRHNSEVRLHVGTLECAARVLLVGRKVLVPGETGWVQLKLDREALVAPGDRFIVRTPSHVATIGGGQLLGAGSLAMRRRGKGRAAMFAERERGLADPAVAVASQTRRAGLAGVERRELVRALMRRPDELEPLVERLVGEGVLVALGRTLLVHGEEAARGEQAIVEALDRFHAQQPLALGLRKATLPDRLQGSVAVVDGLLARLAEDGRVEHLSEGRVRLGGRGAELSAAQQERRDRILEILAADPWQTPRANALPEMVGALPAETDQLLTILEHDGAIVRLKEGILFLSASIDDVKARVREHCAESGTLSPADLRAMLGMTRKYGIPLLEHLDAIGFTRRQGDVRVLR